LPLPPSAPPPAPPTISGLVERDPHLHFAHGGRADLRGKHDTYYCFFSAPGLACNVKTENATFSLHGDQLLVHGSFITEVHVVARVGGAKRKWANLSVWASEFDAFNTGWRVVNGTCGGHFFKLGAAGNKTCEELVTRVGYSSATMEDKKGWTIRVTGNHVYNRLSGPRHRLDISISAADGAAARSLPHGIVGQSFSSDSPRHGATDIYPEEGHFETSANAEGAIEGSAAMYEVPFPYETRFAYSRFDAAERLDTGGLARAGDASAVE